ncbi:unnamed protein product [Lampetra fluviatilis]
MAVVDSPGIESDSSPGGNGLFREDTNSASAPVDRSALTKSQLEIVKFIMDDADRPCVHVTRGHQAARHKRQLLSPCQTQQRPAQSLRVLETTAEELRPIHGYAAAAATTALSGAVWVGRRRPEQLLRGLLAARLRHHNAAVHHQAAPPEMALCLVHGLPAGNLPFGEHLRHVTLATDDEVGSRTTRATYDRIAGGGRPTAPAFTAALNGKSPAVIDAGNCHTAVGGG